MPKLTVSWDENGPLLQTAEVENPMSDRRWRVLLYSAI